MEALSIKEIVKAVEGVLICGNEQSMVTSVSTNSKEAKEGTLFVPIIGEKVDAHDFIESALEQGAVATFTSKEIENIKNNEKGYIRVEDTVKALQLLAEYYRKKFTIPLIGITGSVGKTTTKEMIAAALVTKKNVLKTAGNMNSQVGLPLTIFRIDREHEAAVIEMGMSEEGEMKKLAKIAKPTLAVVTNIGVSHIGQLGSKENIRKEKLNIIDEFGDAKLLSSGENRENDFALYVNGDDTLLSEVLSYKEQQNSTLKGKTIDLTQDTFAKLANTQVQAFGTKENATYFAKNIKTLQGETHFTFVYPGGTEEVKLRVLGIHNVSNALAALAIAMKLGIAPSVSKIGLYEYQPIAMRGQIHDKEGIQIIDDTYNASPDSMKSGINVLTELEGDLRRIAVLADVLELGAASYACHYEVGEYIATLNRENRVDYVITIGNEAKAIAKAIQDKNIMIKTNSFENNVEAIEYLKTLIKSGDAILIKGSRGMHTDEIVEALK